MLVLLGYSFEFGVEHPLDRLMLRYLFLFFLILLFFSLLILRQRLLLLATQLLKYSGKFFMLSLLSLIIRQFRSAAHRVGKVGLEPFMLRCVFLGIVFIVLGLAQLSFPNEGI